MTEITQLAQYGSTGVSIALIIYLVIKDKMFNKTINNHFKHFTDAIDRNTKVIGENAEAMRGNNKILDRVERCLDKHSR